VIFLLKRLKMPTNVPRKPLKTIAIDYYEAGYTAFDLNCIDIPIAGAAGFYNYNNYYFYCFYHTFYHNWSEYYFSAPLNFVDFRKKILIKMGLSLKSSTVANSSKLLSKIKESIDNQYPLLIPVNYRHLFYTRDYIINPNSHFWLISGYDPDDPIIQIREFPIMYETGKTDSVKGHGLYKLNLTEQIVSNIWSCSNDNFKEDNSEFKDCVYSIENIAAPEIQGYTDIVIDFINHFDPKKNTLMQLINNWDTLQLSDDFMEHVRRAFYRAIVVLFEAFEIAFAVPSMDIEKSNSFYQFAEKYIKHRKHVVDLLNLQFIKMQPIGEIRRERMINEIGLMDESFLVFIKGLHEMSAKEWSESG
jgi:hypothetical protein